MRERSAGGALVRVGEGLLRFPRAVVVRVASASGVKRIAGLPPGVAGILVEEGVVVPVVQARVVGAAPGARWILIVRLEDGLMGVPVDDLHSLESLEEADVAGEGDAPVPLADDADPGCIWARAMELSAGRTRA